MIKYKYYTGFRFTTSTYAASVAQASFFRISSMFLFSKTSSSSTPLGFSDSSSMLPTRSASGLPTTHSQLSDNAYLTVQLPNSEQFPAHFQFHIQTVGISETLQFQSVYQKPQFCQRRHGGPHLKRTRWIEESIETASWLWLLVL